MHLRTKTAAVALAVMVSLALAGCAAPTPHVIPTADPSVAPVFASDAAALAAAKKAYLGYIKVGDEITNDGGKDPARITPWVTAADLKIELKGFKELSQSGDHFVGGSVISKVSIQQIDQGHPGKVSTSLYACDDVSSSREINSKGADVTSVDTNEVMPLEVELLNKSLDSRTMLVDRILPWPGSNFCL